MLPLSICRCFAKVSLLGWRDSGGMPARPSVRIYGVQYSMYTYLYHISNALIHHHVDDVHTHTVRLREYIVDGESDYDMYLALISFYSKYCMEYVCLRSRLWGYKIDGESDNVLSYDHIILYCCMEDACVHSQYSTSQMCHACRASYWSYASKHSHGHWT